MTYRDASRRDRGGDTPLTHVHCSCCLRNADNLLQICRSETLTESNCKPATLIGFSQRRPMAVAFPILGRKKAKRGNKGKCAESAGFSKLSKSCAIRESWLGQFYAIKNGHPEARAPRILYVVVCVRYPDSTTNSRASFEEFIATSIRGGVIDMRDPEKVKSLCAKARNGRGSMRR